MRPQIAGLARRGGRALATRRSQDSLCGGHGVLGNYIVARRYAPAALACGAHRHQSTSSAAPVSVPPPGTNANEWLGFFMDSAPVQGMQAMLEAVHDHTGLPWWASIMATTLACRSVLLPLVRHQAHAITRFVQSAPMIRELNEAFARRLDGITPGQFAETNRACRTYLKGLRAALKVHNVSLLSTVSPPLIQIPLFVTFALANRRMIDSGVSGLDVEGLLWFTDLTEADPTLMLPVACLLSTYANLELGFSRLHESQTILRFLKDNLQLLLILFAPATATLPSGVLVYWGTSSLFGHAQFFALRSAAVRSALGFPAIPNQPPAKEPEPGEIRPIVMGQKIVDPKLTLPALDILKEHGIDVPRKYTGGLAKGKVRPKAAIMEGSNVKKKD